MQAGNWDRLLALAPPDEIPLYDYRAMLDKELTAGEDAELHDRRSDHHAVGERRHRDRAGHGVGDVRERQAEVADRRHVPGAVDRRRASARRRARHLASSPPDRAAPAGRSVVATVTTATGAATEERVLRTDAHEVESWCYSGSGADALPFGLFLDPSGGESSTGTVSISVVREGGRWFVSPVTTVLSVLDAGIQHIDQRAVDSMLGVAYELPPDGTITLDQPFQAPASATPFSSRVYAFDGKAGQQVVGEFDSTPQKQADPLAFGFVYTADGESVGEVDFSSLPAKPNDFVFASTAKLPSDGSYRLVLNDVGPASGNTDATLTLWDLADAPKALQNIVASNSDSGSNCTSSPGLFGEQICSSYSTTTPTTSFTYPPATSSSSNSASSCVVTNGTLFCGGATVGKVCPAGVTPSASNACLDPAAVQRFETIQSEIASGGQLSSGSGVGSSQSSSSATTEPVTTAP